MKIFVFGTRGFPGIQGGVEKHCEALYCHFSSNNEVTVFRRRPYVSIKKFRNLNFIDLPSTKIKGFEALFHSFLCSIYSILKRPDIVHIHNIGPALFTPLLKLFRLKVVVTYHSPNYIHNKWNKFARGLLKFSEKITFKFADKIIYVNRGQMALAPVDVKNKSIYLPNGVSSFPKYDSSERDDFFGEYGIAPHQYVLAVGRLTEEKGFDLLIEAFAKTNNPHHYKLVIVGDNPSDEKYCEKLRYMSEDSDVIFTGTLQGKRLAMLYENCYLYVLSSRYEGFPLVLLEAMSFNKMVLVSDFIKDSELPLDEKFFFKTGSVKSLQLALNERLNDILDTKAYPEYDLSKFNWENIAAQTEEVLYGNIS